MKKLDWKETLKVTGILFAICVVVSALLGATYILTYEPILAANEAQAAATRLEVLPADDYIRAECEEDVYLAVSGGRLVGCVVSTSSKGYGGDINVMTGILLTGDVSGVSILELSETPGVGMKVDDPDYLSQYTTATIDAIPAEEFPNEPWSPIDQFTFGEKVDAITGATISSNAVRNAVNEALDVYAGLIEKGALVLPEGYTAPETPSGDITTDTPSDTSADTDEAQPDPRDNSEVIIIE